MALRKRQQMTESSSPSSMKIRCPGCNRKLDVSELAPLSLYPCPHCGKDFRVPKWFQSLLLEDILFERDDLHVYRALDTTLDREVCVKVIESGDCCSDEQLGDFLTVTRRMATIGHPHVVSVYACGRTDSGVYAVQHYIRAKPYAAVLGMSPGALRVTAGRLLGALMEADAAGMSHGGLGPGNILFDEDDIVRVTDFGVARALGKDVSRDVYASPELRGGSAPSRTSDIYSLGVVLHELGTGTLPGAVRSANCAMLAEREGNAVLPPAIADSIGRMLSERAADRPSSYEEIVRALEDKSRPAVARLGKAYTVTADPTGGGVARPGDLPRKAFLRAQNDDGGKHRRRGMQTVNVLLLLGFVALCVLFASYLLRQRRSQRTGVAGTMITLPAAAGAAEAVSGVAAAASEGVIAAESEVTPAAVPGADGGSAPGGVLPSIDPAVWAKRPQPPDLDFVVTHDENQRYLRAVPAGLQESERERLRIIGSARDYLQQIMRRVNYDRGENGRIALRDGRSVRGSIPYVKEKSLTIRRRDSAGGGDTTMEVRFEELAWSQIWDIFAFYAEKRQEMAVGNRMSRSVAVEVFDEYLRIALLCHWYGFAAESRRYASLALAAQPGKKYIISTYGLSAETL